MKKIIIPPIVFIGLSLVACHKSNNDTPPSTSFATVEGQVITDFVNSTGLPQYDSLVSVATALNTAVTDLQANTTDTNLQTAQTAWKNIRTVWEQCEGFLIGPVESFDYDPNTDTWPTAYAQMDSLLASSNPLAVSDVQNLEQYLRGYHPAEYLLFRNGESTVRTAASFTPRQLKYLSSLTVDILNNNVQPLLQSWTSAPVNYMQTILNAGASGNSIYPTKLSFFLDIVGDNGMAAICGEVGGQDADGKMWAPYSGNNNQGDSTITESPYSDNSLNDFRNNIIGAQNVYLGMNGGKGVKDLVAAKNKALDNQIQAQFTAAINSFSNITMRYEQAIQVNGGQRTLVLQTINQINTLHDLLDNDLVNYLKQNVKD